VDQRLAVRSRTAATVAGLLTCAGLAVLGSVADTAVYARLGLPVAAVEVRAAVALLRTVAQLGAALAVGALLLAAFLAPARHAGWLDVDGYRAVRRAGWAAGSAGAAALALTAVTAADQSGTGVGEVLRAADLLGLLATLEEPMAWLLTAVLLLVTAVGCCCCLTRRTARVLVAAAVLALLPVPAVGHGAVGAGHDWGTDAALLHAVAAAVCTGVVAALLVHRSSHGAHGALVWRRGRLLLVVSGTTWAGSALVLALLLTAPVPLTATHWGRLLLAQVALAIALVATWATLRRRVWPVPRSGLLLLLAGSALAGVTAVAMAHAVPPRFLTRPDTEAETLIGYDIDAAPTAWRLLLDWRPNILFALLAVAAAVAYLAGVRALRRRGDRWPIGRTAAWLTGCAVLLLATSSGVGRYAAAMFSVHMAVHMVLMMLAPVLLALGGPATLALRGLRPSGRTAPDGAREWLAALLSAPAARTLTHPLVTLPLFVGSSYALYFTDLFDAAVRFHWAHQAMNVHFLAVGYLFFWPLVGADRAPVRLPPLARLGVVLAAMPFHAFFGIALMSGDTVLGGDFYRSLALPWLPDLLGDQRVGGGIAWATGELPILLVVIALLTQWSREDARAAGRHDRRADRDEDAELRTYNEMLTRLSRSGG
jgi:cytochrome c oxidase assembly factor CtaG/putative copper export protein